MVHLTYPDVDQIISRLPGRVLRGLEQGPDPHPEGCRACDVIWEELNRADVWEEELCGLLAWHMWTTEGKGLVPYLRCMHIYRTARQERERRRNTDVTWARARMSRATDATEDTETERLP